MKALKRQVTTAYAGRAYEEKAQRAQVSQLEMCRGEADHAVSYGEALTSPNVIIKTPTKFFLVSGSSEGFSLLNAFDGALLASGVGDTNLVKMSSILPPGCQELNPRPLQLPQGALVPVAYASLCSDVPGDVISAAVAIGIPKDGERAGLIMEYSAKAEQSVVETQVKKMVEKGMEMRNRAIKEIMSISASYLVSTIGAVFAGVVLWD